MAKTYTIKLTAEQIDIIIDSMDSARRFIYDKNPEYSNEILKVAMEIAKQEREFEDEQSDKT